MLENSTTYSIDRKHEGSFAWRRIGLVALYAAVVIVFFVLIYTTRAVPLFAICPMALFILCLATWRYTQLTNEYVIEVGDITFSRIWGNRNRKTVLKLPVRELLAVYPAEDAGAGQFKRVYDFRGSVKTPDAYCIEFTDGEERSLIYFEATKKAIKLIALYNPNAVRGRKELRY